MAGVYYLTCLLLIILCEITQGQIIPLTNRTAFVKPAGVPGTPIFVSPYSESSCNQGFYYVTNNNSRVCTYSVDASGYISTNCNPLANLTTITCRLFSCIGFNPVTSTMYFFQSLSYVSTTYKPPMNVTFFDLTVYDNSLSGSRLFIVEGNTNSKVWAMLYSSVSVKTPVLIAQLQNTMKVVGFAAMSGKRFAVTYDQGTTVYIYDAINGTLIGNVGTFGRVGPIAVDSNGETHRLFITDYANDCIQIVDIFSNFAHNVINGISTIQNFIPMLGGLLVKDSVAGFVVVQNDEFKIVNVTKNDSTCSSVGADVTIRVRGGSYYYLYSILPDEANLQRTYFDLAYYQFKYYLQPLNPSIAPIGIYNDTLHPVCQVPATTTASVNVSDSTQSVSGNSISATVFGGSGFSISCAGTLFHPYQYYLEFMVRLPPGGQVIALGTTCTSTSYYNPFFYQLSNATIPENTWTKVTVYLPSVISAVYFCDRSSLTSSVANRFYIDNIRLIPENGTRYVEVTDYCTNKILLSTPLVIKDTSALKISNFVSQATSCNNDGSNPALSSDGSVYVNVTGGFSPYSYSWGFSNVTASAVINLGATDYNIMIYQNQLNSMFSDASIATDKTMMDTSKYRSAPYSISFRTVTENEGLSFYLANLNSPLSGNDYYAIQFYVNGGIYGAQFMSMTLKNKASNVGGIVTLTSLADLVALPPNQWVLVRYPIPIGLQFTGVQIYTTLASANPNIPSVMYIDDIILLSYKSRVNVVDSNNCTVSSANTRIVQPTAISVPTVVSNVKCFGSTNGMITVNPQGGTAPYTYSWSTGDISNSASGLSESKVYVNVTDSEGCVPTVKTVSVNVLQPPKLQLVYGTMAPAMCYGAQGTITVTAYGGIGPYTYIWSSLGTSFTVVPKPQPFEIFTDEFKDTISLSSSINATTIYCSGTGSQLGYASHSGYCSLKTIPSAQPSNVLGISCSNCFDNSKYSDLQIWVNFAQSSDVSLCNIQFYNGNSTVSSVIPLQSVVNTTGSGWQRLMINLNQLTGVANQVIVSNSGPMLPFLVDDVVLFSTDTNSLVRGITVNTGFQSVITGTAGSYVLQLTDGNICNSEFAFNITQPPLLNVDSDQVLPSSTGTNGAISVTATGGVPPYTFYWYGMANQSNITHYGQLQAGEYTILVTDANGCFVNHTVPLNARVENSSNTGMIAGIVAGVGSVAVAAAVAGGLYTKRQRKHVLIALQEAEEGERRNYKIDFEHLEIGAAIGAGSFGEVFSGEYKGTDVAIKKLRSQQMTKVQVDEFARESAVMVGLRHPNILLFMGVCTEPSNLCIVTEMMPRGNLMEVLQNQDIRLPTQIIFKMALDTLKGLQFLHSSGFIHRDLKSPNLLVDKYWNIKIADFGLSVARHSVNNNVQVSLLWTAPEILRQDTNCYSFASDMFSFGVIMWELVTKELPWSGVYPPAITAKVVAGERPAINSALANPVKELIAASWHQKPDERPSVKQARSILENDIIVAIGSLDIASMYDGSFASKGSQSLYLRAPPPQPPLALVCCSVAHASELWESDPRGIAKGIEGMINIFRKQSLELSGYEITQDSPYIYAFANPINAINFSLRAQIALRQFDWPKSLLACYNADERKNGNTILQRGLRAKMAVHWCDPVLRKDSFTMKPTYVGEAMKESASLLKHAIGGTTIIDQEMYNQILRPSSGVDVFSINPLGTFTLGDTAIPLYKIVPSTLIELLEVSELDSSEETAQAEDLWLVNFKDIKLAGIIGNGSFGDVYSGVLGNKKVAVKKFVKHSVTSALLLEMRVECSVLSGLSHQNIVKFEGMCLQPPNLCLITELMERGSLSGILHSSVDLPWNRRLGFIKDIARGMLYLHRNQIIHRDIKSPNLLVDTEWNIRIADFGFSRIKAVNQTMTQCGTVAWTAPEIFAGSQYTEKADVYSFAVVLWEIIFRKLPWQGRHAMKIINMVETGTRLPLADMPSDVPESIKSLMVSCWHPDPETRPTFDDIADQLSI